MTDHPDLRIRALDAADAPAVHKLIQRTIDACYTGVYPPLAVSFFKQYHSLDRILERVAAGHVLVVERPGAIIATGSVVGSEITGVFVDPGHQRRGIGGRVMDRLEAIARGDGHSTAQLSVSLPSRRFYEGRGYRVTDSCSIDVGEGQRLDYWEAEKALDLDAGA